MITTRLDDLTEYLKSFRIPAHSTVIIHSSLFHFGTIEGGVAAFYAALRDVFDESFTVVMPAFNWDFERTKRWDYRSTKSQTGVLTEHMRTLPGTLRTIHPFHSVTVRGPQQDLIAGSFCESSFGENSPFETLHNLNAYNLSLGSEFVGGATFLHRAEEVMRVPYRHYKHFDGDVFDASGAKVDATFTMYVRTIKPTYEFVNTWGVFWEDAVAHGLVRYDRYNGATPVFLMNIPDTHDLLCARIRKDPYYVAKRRKLASPEPR